MLNSLGPLGAFSTFGSYALQFLQVNIEVFGSDFSVGFSIFEMILNFNSTFIYMY